MAALMSSEDDRFGGWSDGTEIADNGEVKQGRLENILKNFHPIWFTLPMNSGLLGILMHQLPYQFHGLQTIATIFYIWTIVQFVVIFCVTALRIFMYPKHVFRQTWANVEEIGFYGAPPIAFLTIASLTGLIPTTASWGGHPFAVLAYVLWWIGVGWMFFTAVACFVLLFKSEVALQENLSPALCLPVVGLATAAVAGGLISTYAHDFSPSLGVPAIIVSYILVGAGVWASMIVYALWFHRLAVYGWPKPAKIPALALLVGPMGQSAAAIVLLGTAANTTMDFADYNRGTFLTGSSGSSVAAASTVLSLLFLGFDALWIFIVFYAVLEAAFKRQLSYSLVWWGTIFPFGTTTTCFIVLSSALDSSAFRVLAAGLLILLVIDYLCNLCVTVVRCFTGELLIVSQDKESKEE